MAGDEADESDGGPDVGDGDRDRGEARAPGTDGAYLVSLWSVDGQATVKHRCGTYDTIPGPALKVVPPQILGSRPATVLPEQGRDGWTA